MSESPTITSSSPDVHYHIDTTKQTFAKMIKLDKEKLSALANFYKMQARDVQPNISYWKFVFLASLPFTTIVGLGAIYLHMRNQRSDEKEEAKEKKELISKCLAFVAIGVSFVSWGNWHSNSSKMAEWNLWAKYTIDILTNKQA